MTSLHVLHVIGGGDTGGAMSHLLPLLGALERAGCDVRLLCLGGGGLADQARLRKLSVTVLPMSGAHDPRVLRSLRRVLAAGPSGLRTREPDEGSVQGAAAAGGAASAATAPTRWDVVHTHGMRANLPARLLAPSLLHRPCLFTTVHSDLALDYGSARLARCYRLIDRATVPVVDRIVCVSDSLRHLLLARGYAAERLVTIHSGLEPSEPSPPIAAAGRRPRVGTVARLVAVKDIDLLVEVASLLCRTHPELEMVIVGDGPERARLEALTADKGLTDTVRFVGRLADAAPVLRELDLYMMTSVFEGGVSMSVLEAMENGLPVVTTAAGGVTEIVVDGETGYVVSRDLERGALAAALAEHVVALLNDPALRTRMGTAGARRVRDRFTIDQTAAQTLRAYTRCVAARTGRS